MPGSVVKNAADPQQVKEAAGKEKRVREHELNDIREVVNSAGGRRFVWRYLEICGVFRSSFTGNNTTFFNEGHRNVGLKLLADLMEGCPERYIQMMTENKPKDD